MLPGAQFTSEEEVLAVLSQHGSSRPGSQGPAEPHGVSTPGAGGHRGLFLRYPDALLKSLPQA